MERTTLPKLRVSRLATLATRRGQTIEEYLEENPGYGGSRYEKQHWERKILEAAARRIDALRSARKAAHEHTA